MSNKSFMEYFHKKIGVTDAYQAPDRLMEILLNKEEREELFLDMLDFMDYDVDYDWFHQYFQDEHANRKKLKQDYSPNEVGVLLSRIVKGESSSEFDDYYEVGAGSGGLMIQHWNEQRYKESPFTYSTWEHFHTVEEVSDRTIPFLIFNMMIRGMNGVVLHVDTIERDCKGIFFIQNFHDDHLGFSDINILPYEEHIEKLFNVKFTEEKYPAHKERNWFDDEHWSSIAKLLCEKEQKRMALDELRNSNLDEDVKSMIEFMGMY